MESTRGHNFNFTKIQNLYNLIYKNRILNNIFLLIHTNISQHLIIYLKLNIILNKKYLHLNNLPRPHTLNHINLCAALTLCVTTVKLWLKFIQLLEHLEYSEIWGDRPRRHSHHQLVGSAEGAVVPLPHRPCLRLYLYFSWHFCSFPPAFWCPFPVMHCSFLSSISNVSQSFPNKRKKKT